MSTDDPQHDQTPEPLPAIPADESQTPDHFTHRSQRLVTVLHAHPTEAELAKAKLAFEGIPGVVIDAELAAVHSLLMAARLQVHEADEERAREILSRPAEDAPDGDYVSEDWRCPQCHRKGVELLPLSAGWRRTRLGCLTILLLPLLIVLAQAIIQVPEISRVVDRLFAFAAIPWLLVVAGLSIAMMMVRRSKRCAHCGHEWAHKAGEEAEED